MMIQQHMQIACCSVSAWLVEHLITAFGKLSSAFVMRLQWLKEGKLIYMEDVTDGLENAPKAFIGMMRGDSIGKATVKVADSNSAC